MSRLLFLALFACLVVIGGYAQSPQYSIFDALEKRPKSGEGGVIVHQPESIKRLVGTRIDSENVDLASGKTFIKTMGYRIQVYSGNNQRTSNQLTSKEEATSLQKKIKELSPGNETYIEFIAPFWKLSVGDFPTFEEASIIKRDLHKAFPQRKNEIYIIESEIRLPLE